MKVTHLYTGADGDTHFEDVEIFGPIEPFPSRRKYRPRSPPFTIVPRVRDPLYPVLSTNAAYIFTLGNGQGPPWSISGVDIWSVWADGGVRWSVGRLAASAASVW